MLYKEAVTYIENIPKFAGTNTLEDTRVFLSALGNPQENYKVIHVAGTNGKGSTCSFLNSMLLSMNKKVGLFTSPHLISIRERIRMNGNDCKKEEFTKAFNQVYDIVKSLEKEGIAHPSFFTFLMLIAWLVFEKNELDYVILETGLGGRLDATNTVKTPIATVITSIGLDHQQYLGNTIEKIAYEKAGIIKENVTLIYEDNNPTVTSIFEERAKKLNCKCKKISNSAYEIKENIGKDIAILLPDEYDRDSPWILSNVGQYQVKNLILAITTMKEIVPNYTSYLSSWKGAVKSNQWEGRMEEIYPNIYVDGAHNIPAIKQLAQEIKEINLLLFGAVKDKQYQEMIEILTTNIKINTIIVTTIPNKRGVFSKELKKEFSKYTQAPIIEIDNAKQAWDYICQETHKKEHSIMNIEEDKYTLETLCLGSLFLVGDIKKYEKQKRNNNA